MIWDQYHLCAIPANNTQPESDDLKLMSILHNNWPVLFKIVKVKKDKNSTRIQEIGGTEWWKADLFAQNDQEREKQYIFLGNKDQRFQDWFNSNENLAHWIIL